jgi:hypothetical protein
MFNIYLKSHRSGNSSILEVSDCGVHAVREDAWREYQKFCVWTFGSFYVCEYEQRCASAPHGVDAYDFSELCAVLRQGWRQFFFVDGQEYVKFSSERVLTSSALFNLTDVFCSYGDLVLPSGAKKSTSSDIAVGDRVLLSVLMRGILFSCEYLLEPEDGTYIASTLVEACHRAVLNEQCVWTFRDNVDFSDVYYLVRVVAS